MKTWKCKQEGCQNMMTYRTHSHSRKFCDEHTWGRGGKRPGAGRPKGSRNPKSKLKTLLELALNAKIS